MSQTTRKLSPTKTVDVTKSTRPALTPEARENQMINLAIDLVERQLRDGSASSQVVTHYLKLASTKERVELEKLQLEKELVAAKTENLRSNKQVEELYKNALRAMRTYSGGGNENVDENNEDEY